MRPLVCLYTIDCIWTCLCLYFFLLCSPGVGATLPCVLQTLRGDVTTTTTGGTAGGTAVPLVWSYDTPTLISISLTVWPIAGSVSVTMTGG